MSKLLDTIVGSAVAAKLLVLTSERIRQLSRAGYFTNVGKGRTEEYRLGDLVAGYVKFLRTETPESKVHEARTREIELRTLERAHKLADVEECVAAVEEVFGLYRAELAAAPAMITRDLAQRQAIEQVLNDISNRVSARLVSQAKMLRDRGEAYVGPTPLNA